MICLPSNIVEKLKTNLKNGTINPDRLSSMTPGERHSLLEDIVGKDNASGVNALIESKLALKDQQRGLISAMNELLGNRSPVVRGLIDKINRMTDVLNPEDESKFYQDLASKKLGIKEVSLEQANKISELAKKADEAKLVRDKNVNPESIRNYGRVKEETGDYVNSLKPNPNRSIGNVVSNVLNIPKSLLTSVLHFSASGVQLWGSITTPQFWKGAIEQFKYFANEENYKNARADISGHPDYDIAKRAGLGITSIDNKLNDREEAIQSSLLQEGSTWLSNKTGFLPDFIRSSSRAFTGYLNYVRFGRFEDLLNAARLQGKDVSLGSEISKDLANVVNSFSGRGKIPFGLDRSQSALNTFFFSPRKIAGAIDMFNPMTYLDPRIDSLAKKTALKQLTGSLLVTTSILTLAKLMGGQVETNPVGTNFGKVKIGDTTIDLTGGNASYVRLVSQIISNKEKSSTGKITSLGGILQKTSKTGKVSNTPFTAPTRADKVFTYIRDHASPIASLIWDWAAGSNPVGQPVTIRSEAKQELTPLVTQAFYDMYKNDPQTFKEIWPLLPSVFGFSTQSNAPITQKKK